MWNFISFIIIFLFSLITTDLNLDGTEQDKYYFVENRCYDESCESSLYVMKHVIEEDYDVSVYFSGLNGDMKGCVLRNKIKGGLFYHLNIENILTFKLERIFVQLSWVLNNKRFLSKTNNQLLKENMKDSF